MDAATMNAPPIADSAPADAPGVASDAGTPEAGSPGDTVRDVAKDAVPDTTAPGDVVAPDVANAAEVAVEVAPPPDAAVSPDVDIPDAPVDVADAGSVDTAAPDAPVAMDTQAPDVSVDVAPADVAPSDVGPLADPILAQPLAATIGLVLEEVVTMPQSHPSPNPTDPRLQRSSRINYLGEVPDGSGRLFVPDLNGRLYLLVGGTARVYLDVGAQVGADFWDHRGLGTGFGFVAFHPDFRSNGRFYTVHTEARDALGTKTPDLPSQANPAHQGVLTEWTAADPGADAFTGTRREVLRLGFSSYLHGIQEVGFNPNAQPGDADRGLLYLAVGDGGVGIATGDPQDLGKPHGKVLRIDPTGNNGANGRYGIPNTNPFVGRPGVLGEIYAYGLRDPHRFGWDTGPGGRLLLANIGEHNVESIYEVRPGDNFGWPEREGPFQVRRGDSTCSVFPLPANDAASGFTYPVVAYDHDPSPGFPRCLDTGDAIMGGFVYRGTRAPALVGEYVFGDIVNGRLFHAHASEMRRNEPPAAIHALAVVDQQGRTVTMQTLAGDSRVDLRFGRDAAGELYLLSKANSKIWRVTSTVPLP